MNVVFDTNIYISALVFPGGLCDQIVRICRLGKFKLSVSPDILTELKLALEKKFKYAEEEAVEIVDMVLAIATIIYPRFRVQAIEHPDADNRILECALEADADFLVTGDKRHILPLKKFKNTRIISPAQFMELLAH